MTYRELSNAFDVYVNRHAEAKLGSLLFFDEYEKSLFITMAANEIVKEMLPFYERNEKTRQQLFELTKSYEGEMQEAYPPPDHHKIDVFSLIYELPSDLMHIVMEQLRSQQSVLIRMIRPISDDEYYYTLDNPFRTSSRGYAYRNDISYEFYHPSYSRIINKKYAEIVSDVKPGDWAGSLSYMKPRYYCKYISTVPPIIVTDSILSASIGGVSTNANPEYDAPLVMLHEKILNRAVQIGYMAKSDDPNAKTAASNLSEDS